MLWIKAFHIISVVTWFAALFYLPRLFIYHLEAKRANDAPGCERLARMESKLYRGIMTPSAVLVVVLGLWLYGFNPAYYYQAGWMWLKLVLVLSLLVFHWLCRRYMGRLAASLPMPSMRFLRWFNEYPALVLIGVVLLVELQPGLF